MIAADTLIECLSDLSKLITIDTLYKTHSDTVIPVFTQTLERITVGCIERIVHLGKAPICVVETDGSTLKVTPDQKFLLLDGSLCSAADLVAGKSLMPLYLRVDKIGNTLYLENTDYNAGALVVCDAAKERKVSRMVAETLLGSRLPKALFVTHVDDNKNNCHPSNIAVEHRSGYNNKCFIHPFIKAMKDAKEFIQANQRNHKVINVTSGGMEDVFGCIMKRGENNFAACGVFLKSAEDE